MTRTTTLVAELEHLEMGAAYADALQAAREAVATDLETAEAALFPDELRPQSADVFAAIRHHSERWNAGPAYQAGLLDLHAKSLTTWPELADALRANDMVEDVAQAAAALASRTQRDETEVAAESRRSCRAALAAQLAKAKHELGPKARSYLEALDLERRTTAAANKHQTHIKTTLNAAADLRRHAEERRIQESNLTLSAAVEAIDTVRVEGRRAEIEAEKKLAALLIERVEKLGRKPADTIRIGNEAFGAEHLLASLRRGSTPEFMQRLAAALRNGRA